MKTRISALLFVCVLLTVGAFAQNTSSLKPPAGHRMAIVIFEDFQCPSCSQVEPLVQQAVNQYKIPLVRHDFPLPQHNWSMEAHVTARWFDTKSPELGEKFRHWVLINQRSIYKPKFRQMAEQFAQQNGVALPLFVDPDGQLAAKVNADKALGQQVGINQTPTIFVVGDVKNSPAVLQVHDNSQLLQTVEQMKRAVDAEKPAAAPAKASKPATKKKSATKK